MNSCILMVEIVQDPQIRYTSDNQTPIAEMLVQFPGLSAEQQPSTLKVVGWGNLAQEIQNRYHQGDRVLVEGRLRMLSIDRPEGFKEKRAELTAQRIHDLVVGDSVSASPSSSLSSGTGGSVSSATTTDFSTQSVTSESAASPAPTPVEEPNYDDIPF